MPQKVFKLFLKTAKTVHTRKKSTEGQGHKIAQSATAYAMLCYAKKFKNLVDLTLGLCNL